MTQNVEPHIALSDEVILDVKGLKTQFPTRTGLVKAVDDVSFQLRHGKTTCIVGESGSGKSITARSILQILDPPGEIVAGTIRLITPPRAGGRSGIVDLTALPARSRAIRAIRGRDIAMIFQEPMSSLSPVHTIGDQIIETIRLHEAVSNQQARERSIELLRRTEIEHPETAIDRYTFEFSGGMRQRAMIAMALSCNPQVLIADEPTTALDVTTQAEILDLMRELQKSYGMALMFITHDMGVVAEIADDVVVMRHGKVVENNTVEALFSAPQHAYTKRLLNSVIKLENRAAQKLPEATLLGQLAEPVLDIRNVSIDFALPRKLFRRAPPPFRAVDKVSFTLYRGESLGIVGESGSGKTTLGRAIASVFVPTHGSISYGSGPDNTTSLARMRGAELAQYRRRVRMIFQDPYGSLNPRMTVGQIIAEPLINNSALATKSLQDRVAELLHQVGLPADIIERYPHAFSGGQRQRISIARAIALTPEIIICDEATSALDVSIRSQVLDLLIELQESLDLSFIFISHDIGVVRYFCDRVAVMRQGKIVELGAASRVCSSPEHPYTQALLSAIPNPDPTRRKIHLRQRYAGEDTR